MKFNMEWRYAEEHTVGPGTTGPCGPAGPRPAWPGLLFIKMLIIRPIIRCCVRCVVRCGAVLVWCGAVECDVMWWGLMECGVMVGYDPM